MIVYFFYEEIFYLSVGQISLGNYIGSSVMVWKGGKFLYSTGCKIYYRKMSIFINAPLLKNN